MTAVPDPEDEAAWVGPEVDRDRPDPARMYDDYLGGAHDVTVDRELAAQALAAMPWRREAVRANRGFLRRAVALRVEEGLDQFLDQFLDLERPVVVFVISHVTAEHDPDESEAAVAAYRRSANPVTPRSRDTLAGMLAGFDLVEPGLVDTSAWCPDRGVGTGEHAGFYAAVARRR